jgi:anti-sigma factor RsiW
MTLSSKDMLDVMAWADGELEGDEAARIEALIEKDSEAKELVRSFGALGDFVRTSSFGTAHEKASTPDVSAEIMAKIGPNDIERARLKRGMRTRVGAAVATALALAAGFLIWQRTHTNDQPTTGKNDIPVVNVPAATGVEVGQVDSSQHAVSVFYVPSSEEKGPETTVVWIDDNQPSPE